jgi:hypothetical protein
MSRGSYRSDWTTIDMKFDQSVARQSAWSPEPVRTISSANAQIGPSISTSIDKSNGLSEPIDVTSNVDKYINHLAFNIIHSYAC